jgi:hypothetical protein
MAMEESGPEIGERMLAASSATVKDPADVGKGMGKICAESGADHFRRQPESCELLKEGWKKAMKGKDNYYI